jgi:uncharacterized metal-binding protein
MVTTTNALPLVYSCSGCSSAAQLANHIAVRLDREGDAEMSCIAGVGGDVKPLVHKALSGRGIVAIDGCVLHCVKHVLARHGINPRVHVDLGKRGVKKVQHGDFDPEQAQLMLGEVRREVHALRERSADSDGFAAAMVQHDGRDRAR